MALNTFTGSSGTALATYDSAWTANTVNDGIGALQLDGSGNLRLNDVNQYTDVFYNDGNTDEDSKSRVVLNAGLILNNARCLFRVACRRTTTQLGYAIALRSNTSVNTNFDRIDLLKNGENVATKSVDLENFGGAAIDASTTPIDISVQAVEGVNGRLDIVCELNGRTLTFSALADNQDPNGETPLTGGYPGLSIHMNGSGAGATVNDFLVTSWTDDVTSASITGNGALTAPVATVSGTGDVYSNAQITDTFVDENEDPVASVSDITVHIWLNATRPTSPTPDVVLTSQSLDASGVAAWNFNPNGMIPGGSCYVHSFSVGSNFFNVGVFTPTIT